jgi:hypothetical protein
VIRPKRYSGQMDERTPTEELDEREARHRKERQAVEEAGGGQSEGFELAEQELIEHTSHGDQHTPSRIMRDAPPQEEEPSESVYGESDEEHQPD